MLKNCITILGIDFSTAIELAVKTLDAKNLVDLGATAHIPNLKECNRWQQDYANREYTECLTRTVGLTSHHFGGTCKIGEKHEGDAVVDKYLRWVSVERMILYPRIFRSSRMFHPNIDLLLQGHRSRQPPNRGRQCPTVPCIRDAKFSNNHDGRACGRHNHGAQIRIIHFCGIHSKN